MNIIKKLNSNIPTIYLISITIFFIYALFFHFQVGSNEESRLALVYALGNEGTIKIDNYHTRTIDKSYWKGHYYSEKAFGTSLFSLPFYLFSKFLGKILNLSSYNFYRYITTILTISFSSALLTLFLGKILLILKEYFKSELNPYIIILAYSFGTLIFPFSTLFFGHVLCAFFLFISFFILWQMGTTGKWKGVNIFFSGLLAGFGIITEYTSGIIVVSLLLFILLFPSSRLKRAFLFFLPAFFLPAILVMGYNYLCFENPFQLGYVTQYFEYFQENMTQGFLGIKTFRFSSLFLITFSLSRGIFFLSPFLIFIFWGFYYLLKDKNLRNTGITILFLFIIYLIVNASYYQPSGANSFGPRHLIPTFPFLMIPLGVWFYNSTNRIIFYIFVIYSIFITTLANTFSPLVPEPFKNPVYSYFFRLFKDGSLNETIFSYLGISGRVSFFVILFIILYLILKFIEEKKIKTKVISLLGGVFLIIFFLSLSAILHKPLGLDDQLIGNLFDSLNNTKKAIYYYEEGVKKGRRDPYLFLFLGKCYIRLGNLEKGEKYLLHILELGEDIKEVYIELANLYALQGDKEKFIEILKKFSEKKLKN